MKILYVSNSRLPTEKAYGIQIIKMCEAFSASNVKTGLILPTRKNREFKDINIFEYYQVKDDFDIKKIPCFDPYFLISLPKGIYIKFQMFFFMVSLFFYLIFKKNKDKYIFYTRDEYLLPLLQLFSKKVVWEAHTLPTRKKYYLKYWGKCSKIITISQGLKAELLNLGTREQSILTAPDGVDLSKYRRQDTKYEIREKLKLPQDKKIIMYTGHLYDWKGAQVLANASKHLNGDCWVVFIGGTKDDIENFKNKNKNCVNIEIAGYKKPKEIPDYLKAADILVLPNLATKKISSHYTSPLKLFEYLASGRPIIASALPSLKEVADKFDGIFYFEPGNANELLNKLRQIPINKDYSRNLENYSWTVRAKNIIDFIYD